MTDKFEEIQEMGCVSFGAACESCTDTKERLEAFEWLIAEVKRLREELAT